MKRKYSSTRSDGSDEEESIKGISSFDVGEFDQKLASIDISKAEENIEGKSSFTLFDPDEKIPDFTFSEPREIESIKAKSSFTFFGSEGKSSDFTFSEPKGVKFIKKENFSSTLFDSEGKFSDSNFFEPKLESVEGKLSSAFSGSGGKIPGSTFNEPKLEETIEEIPISPSFSSKGKSPDITLTEPIRVESMQGKSTDVFLEFDNRQDNVEFSILTERLHEHLKGFEIYVSRVDRDVLEVGVTGKIFIPVFSKGFASNESCLRNLVSMVHCRSYSATNHIVPIYFGVEPSDVRLDTPSYKHDLDELRRRFEDKVVNRWTEALIEVSNISGWLIPENVGPKEIDDIVNEVCQMVLHKLRISLLRTRPYLIGMNQHVENIIDMLNLEVNDVKGIAISGVGPVGKTTLARAVYDKLSSSFEGCSFLGGIEEKYWTRDNKVMQAKLVSDLLNKKVDVFQSVDEGIDLIRERFCYMKVLIVLDYWLWKPNYINTLVGELNWLGPGSRIIVTASWADDRSIPSEYSIYDLSSQRPRLSDQEIFDLFSHHAFPKCYPLPDFYELSKELSRQITRHRNLSYLDVEIVGSLLYGKSKAEWGRTLLHLRQQDHGFFKNLDGMLRMSFDSLTEKQKEIFLDISCLPDGMDKRIVLLLYDDHSLHSQYYHDFEVLIRLLLVKIDANDRIWMQWKVRDFGETVVKRNGTWWLTGRKGPVDVGSMRYFKMMHENVLNLDRNELKHRNIVGHNQFPNFLEANYHATSLKILDLSWSKITEEWKTWGQIQAPQLRVLNLTGCVDLMVTPSFSFCPNLEMLILERCSQLVKIDPSIQGLQKLATLNLRYCKELSVLPKEIGCLNALKELLIDGTSVQEIPVSIGRLKKLQVLTTINCSSLTQLPSSTRNLVFITTLKLDCAKIPELPCSILQRMKIQYLSLRDCRCITNLGSFAGEVERSLLELDVSGTSISELPASISKLKFLRVLKMDSCFVREFPLGFGELKKLEEVYASWCKGLENLPHDIGEVESLRILKVGHSQISHLPQSIQLLKHLEILDCTSCNKLQGLPMLPSSLSSLYVQSKKLRDLSGPHNLVNLKEFTLGSDDIVMVGNVSLPFSIGVHLLGWLPRSYYMRTLVLCLPNAKELPGFPPNLRKLTLQCTNLEHIPSFPSTLVVMSIQNFRLLKEFPSVENLERLQQMEVICCPEIEKIEGLERLISLKILTVLGCGINLLDGLGELFSLRRLTLQDCRSLSKLPNVGRLKELLEMKIRGCPEIDAIVGHERLRSLKVLSISNCGIRSLDGLDKLSSLRRLTITDCSSLREVPDLSNMTNLKEKCVLLEDPEYILEKL